MGSDVRDMAGQLPPTASNISFHVLYDDLSELAQALKDKGWSVKRSRKFLEALSIPHWFIQDVLFLVGEEHAEQDTSSSSSSSSLR